MTVEKDGLAFRRGGGVALDKLSRAFFSSCVTMSENVEIARGIVTSSTVYENAPRVSGSTLIH